MKQEQLMKIATLLLTALFIIGCIIQYLSNVAKCQKLCYIELQEFEGFRKGECYCKEKE